MEDEHPSPKHAGWYERSVAWVTDAVKPYLHRVTEKFVKKSVKELAPDNEHYARIIEFEIRRRGDGAGLTQDVAEPTIWIGVKSALAVGIEVLMKPFKSLEAREWKWIGHGAALSIILQQAVELFRIIPRYRAGLQGSLEMAKDRWKSIEETGVDPFDSQTREINRPLKPQEGLKHGEEKRLQSDNNLSRHTDKLANRSISPEKIREKQDHDEIYRN